MSMGRCNNHATFRESVTCYTVCTRCGSDLVNAKEDQGKTSHFRATVADSCSTNEQAQNVFEALC